MKVSKGCLAAFIEVPFLLFFLLAHFIYEHENQITPLTGFSVVAWDNEYPPTNTEIVKWSTQDFNAHHGDDAGPHTPYDWKSSDVDLNSGAGGKYVYLIWRTGEIEKEPIFRIIFIESNSKLPPYYKG
ncbi:hypothetical protein F8M41_023035 [Gigaspora margarita]|uniref:Uncharacterized protein n=1 Tax=Gigaspora margarita TaxID=4874 RepID=A0A8H4EHL3_GIGMA|nr:hypothetical protein F8M41_023035 [Gigaspora margarita]